MNSWGIKGRVLFLALAPVLVIAAGLTAYDINTRLRDNEQALNERGLAIARQLAPASEFGVFSGNHEILIRLARTTLQEADVTSVSISNTEGNILAAVGRPLANPPLRETSTLKKPDVTVHPTALVFSSPIVQSQTEVEHYLNTDADEQPPPQVNTNKKILGHVIVEISRLPSFSKRNQIILNSLLITLAGLAAAALLALRMARQVTQPIMTLAGTVARIGKGDLDTRVHMGSAGEIGTLERGINNMAVALSAVQDAQEERRAILATVLDSLDALVYVADMESHELLFLNKFAREAFGNVTGKLCWQALQSNQNGPCPFCTNSRLLRQDGQPDEPVIWEFQNTINRHWYMIQDSAIKWVDGRIVRLEIATDITSKKKTEEHVRNLERQIMDISERERERIGYELHDGLGQQLTGIAFLCKALSQKLAAQSLAEAKDASQIVTMINQSVLDTRQLARGLQPVEVEENGLMSALETLAANIENLFHVRCEFRCDTPVLVQDNAVANHLYRIAQEAATNSVKHGKAARISIELAAPQGRIQLIIRDDGKGFEPAPDYIDCGIGLQIMRYRANIIGASLEIETAPAQGTQLRIYF